MGHTLKDSACPVKDIDINLNLNLKIEEEKTKQIEL